MKALNKLYLKIALIIFLSFLNSCTVIKNSFNYSPNPKLNQVSEPSYKSLYYSDFSKNSLDLHILNEKDNNLISLHLDRPNGSENMYLSGFSKSIKTNSDSIHFKLAIPIEYLKSISYLNMGESKVLLKNENTKYKSLNIAPVYISKIDSINTGLKLKTYAALCKDNLGHEYYISSITDPIPFIIIVAIGAAAVYKYYSCEEDIRNKIIECRKINKLPDFEVSLLEGCQIKSCK